MPHANEPGSGDAPVKNLAIYPATPRTKVLAGCLVAAMLVIAVVAVEFGRRSAPALPAFLPLLTGAIVAPELISAYIFFGHYRAMGWRQLLFLGAAYCSAGFLAMPFMLTFPGVFSPSGLFGANEQTAVYLWLCWHALFPAFILAAALLRYRTGVRPAEAVRWRHVAYTVAATMALAGGLGFAFSRWSASLPVLIANGEFTQVVHTVALPLVCGIDVLAIVALLLVARPYSATSVWLAVALTASALDTAMGLVASRYAYSWYAGKIFSVVSSSIILAGYIREMIKLQARLASTTDELRHINQVERREAQNRLVYLAYHDEMTGLPNRSGLQDLLRRRLEEARNPGGEQRQFALLFIDLDRFKEVNDVLGHAKGDGVLIEAGRRLREAVLAGSTVGRLGGDEFAIVAAENARDRQVDRIAERALLAMRQPFVVDGHRFELSASIGIARFPEQGHTVDALLQHADVALYNAKRAGGSRRCYFTTQMGEERDRDQALRDGLVRAVRESEFVLHYQPFFDLRAGRSLEAEALIRWVDPSGTLRKPASFIPAIERFGLMDSVGRWTLETAIGQMRRWNDAGHAVKVSVNVSTKQLQDGTFFKELRKMLRKAAVPAEQLQLEVTESAAMEDTDGAIELLKRCRALGVTIALDDFGTHYSSLTYLQRLPTDVIKIDGSFITGLTYDNHDAAIVRSIISLGHDFGRTIVAECVETKEQLNWLRREGCDVVQGYVIARPMCESDFLAWKNSAAPLARAG